jgi:hypothetical protein
MDQTGLKDRLAILRKSNLQSLPLIYMLKDKEGRFQFITDLAAQHTGAVSGDELINRALGDLKSDAANYASEFEYYDAMSKDQRSEVLLLSLIHSEKGADISLICNKPIINDKNEVEGVEIWVQVLPSV